MALRFLEYKHDRHPNGGKMRPLWVDEGGVFYNTANHSYAGGATDGRNGYGFHIAGQNTPGSEVDVIQKYPFTSPSAGSDVGEYSASRQLGGKQVSGTTEFWTTDNSGNIYKGAFASPADTSDVGEVSTTVTYSSATQY